VEIVVIARHRAGERAGIGRVLRLRPRSHEHPDVDGERGRGHEGHAAHPDEHDRHAALVASKTADLIAHRTPWVSVNGARASRAPPDIAVAPLSADSARPQLPSDSF